MVVREDLEIARHSWSDSSPMPYMTRGKEKRAKSILENSTTSCSEGYKSQTTGRILMKIQPVESRRNVLSNGLIGIKIRPVV